MIAIDIGGTKCAVACLRPDGTVKEVERLATRDKLSTLNNLKAAVARLKPGADPIFGISAGGPLDAARGLILSPPNLPGWDRVAICDEFTQAFGGRAHLMNDANACALAEWRFGAGRGCQHMIFLTAGTGMGAGLIFNGRLYEGASGDAGEVGHIRLGPEGPVGYGKAGSFEGFCSGGGIARLAQAHLSRLPIVPGWALPLEDISMRQIAEAAFDGEGLALEILHQAGRRLGQALAILIDTLNPERIVIGGIFPRCHELLQPAMEEALQEEALGPSLVACRVVPAQLGETIGSCGAISIALHYLESACRAEPALSDPTVSG